MCGRVGAYVCVGVRSTCTCSLGETFELFIVYVLLCLLSALFIFMTPTHSHTLTHTHLQAVLAGD